jgi:hypothetical protein
VLKKLCQKLRQQRDALTQEIRAERRTGKRRIGFRATDRLVAIILSTLEPFKELKPFSEIHREAVKLFENRPVLPEAAIAFYERVAPLFELPTSAGHPRGPRR